MHNLLTAQTKQWEQFETVESQLEQKNTSKAKVRKKQNYAYGFQKFCGMILGCAFLLGILLLAEHALVISQGYKIIAIKKEITALKNDNDRLQLKIAQLKDLRRVEYLAIAKLKMVKPDESQTEFMELTTQPVETPKVAKIVVEPKPGKKINPVVSALNDLVKGWVSTSTIQINPEG